MNAKRKLLFALAAGAIGLGASGSAMAGQYGQDQHQYGHQQQHRYQQQYRYQQYRHHHRRWKHDHRRHRYAVRERVVVERPVYVERYVQYAPPRRNPAIVLRVDLPSLVFGLH